MRRKRLTAQDAFVGVREPEPEETAEETPQEVGEAEPEEELSEEQREELEREEEEQARRFRRYKPPPHPAVEKAAERKRKKK